MACMSLVLLLNPAYLVGVMMTKHINTKASKQSEIERIISVLGKAIAHRRLKPGQRLIESQLVDILSANRNHIQAALQRMALSNIISIEHNRGAVVSQPSAREAKEVFSARRALELGIIDQITPAKMQKYEEKLAQHVNQECEAIASQDRHLIMRELSQFHLQLAEVAENSVLKEMLENLLVRSSIIEVLYHRNSMPSCASGEHQKIILSLKNGDNGKAAQLMVSHLEELEAQLVLEEEAQLDFDLASALADI